MPRPIWAAEQQAGLIDGLPILGFQALRTLTAFRRRHGLLPAPAAKLVEALRETARFDLERNCEPSRAGGDRSSAS